MSALEKRVVRPAALEMIGVIMVLWAFLAFMPSGSLFYRVLATYGTGATRLFFAVMFALGAVLVACSWWRVPERFLERVLVISAMAIFAGFMPFLLAGVITPVSVTMPYLGACCLRLMTRDFSRW